MSALDRLAKTGYQPEFGARLLRRALRRELDKPLARMLLGGEVGPGDTVHVDLEDGELALTAESATDSASGTSSEAPDAKSGASAEA